MKDSKRTSLIHFGKDNIRYESEYEVHDFLDVQKQINKIEFRIFIKDYKEIEWFDFKLFVMPDNSLKVTDMFVGNSSQRMKGKSEAAILEAKKVFQKKIISSSNKEDVIYEWRSEQGDKVWKRLVEKGLAIFKRYLDIYELI